MSNTNINDLYDTQAKEKESVNSGLSSVILEQIEDDDKYIDTLEKKRKIHEKRAKKIVMKIKKKTKENGEYENFTSGYSKYLKGFKDLESIVPYSNRGIPNDIKLDESVLEIFKEAVKRREQVNKKLSLNDLSLFKTILEKKQEELEAYQKAKATIKAKARIINMTSTGISLVVTVGLPFLLFYLPGLAPFLGLSPYSTLATAGSNIIGFATNGGVLNGLYTASQIRELYNKRAEIYITTKKYLVKLERAKNAGNLKKYISEILIDGVVGIITLNGMPIGYMGIDHLNISTSIASILFNCGSAALSSAYTGQGAKRGGDGNDWVPIGTGKFNFLQDTSNFYKLKEDIFAPGTSEGKGPGLLTNIITGPCKSILGKNLSSSLKLRFNGDDKPYNPSMTEEEKIIKKYEAEAQKNNYLEKEINFIKNTDKSEIEVLSQIKRADNLETFTDFAFIQRDLLKDKKDKGKITEEQFSKQIEELEDNLKKLQRKELDKIKQKLKSGEITPREAQLLIEKQINDSKSLRNGLNKSYYKKKAISFAKYALPIVIFQTVIATLTQPQNLSELYKGLRLKDEEGTSIYFPSEEYLLNLLKRFRMDSLICEAIKNEMIVGRLIQVASTYLQKFITDYKVIENSVYYGLYTGFVFKNYTSKIIDYLKGNNKTLKDPWPKENLFGENLKKDEYDELVKNFKIKDFFIGLNNIIPEPLKKVTKWIIGKGDLKKGEERVKYIIESQFIQQVGNIQVSDIFQKVIGSMVSNTLLYAAHNYTKEVAKFTKNIEISYNDTESEAGFDPLIFFKQNLDFNVSYDMENADGIVKRNQDILRTLELKQMKGDSEELPVKFSDFMEKIKEDSLEIPYDYLSMKGELYSSGDKENREAVALDILRKRDSLKYNDLSTVIYEFIIKPALFSNKLQTDNTVDDLMNSNDSIFNRLITSITNILTGKSFVNLYEAISNWIQETIHFNKTFIKWMFTDKYNDELNEKLGKIRDFESKKPEELTPKETEELSKLKEDTSANAITKLIQKIFLDPTPWREQVRDSKLKKAFAEFNTKLELTEKKMEFLESKSLLEEENKQELKRIKMEFFTLSMESSYKTPGDFMTFERKVFDSKKALDDFGKTLDGKIKGLTPEQPDNIDDTEIKRTLIQSLQGSIREMVDDFKKGQISFDPDFTFLPQIKDTEIDEMIDTDFNQILDDSNFLDLFNKLDNFRDKVNEDLLNLDTFTRNKDSLLTVKGMFSMRSEEIERQKETQLNLLETLDISEDEKTRLTDEILGTGLDIDEFNKMYQKSVETIKRGGSIDLSEFKKFINVEEQTDRLSKTLENLEEKKEFVEISQNFESLQRVFVESKQKLLANSGEFFDEVERELSVDKDLNIVNKEIEEILNLQKEFNKNPSSNDLFNDLKTKMKDFNEKYSNSYEFGKIVTKFDRINTDINQAQSVTEMIETSTTSEDLFNVNQKIQELNLQMKSKDKLVLKLQEKLEEKSQQIFKEEETAQKLEEFQKAMSEAKARAEEQAKREEEEEAKREAEEKAKREAEEQAKREAEEQAKREAEAEAERKAAEEQAKSEEEKIKLQEDLVKKLKEIINTKYKNLLKQIEEVKTIEQLQEKQTEALKLQEDLDETQKTGLNTKIEEKRQELTKTKPPIEDTTEQQNTLSEVDAKAFESLKENANKPEFKEFFTNLCINSGGSDCENFQNFIKEMNNQDVSIKQDKSGNQWYFYIRDEKVEDISQQIKNQEGLKTFLNSMKRMKTIISDKSLQDPIYSEKELIYRMRSIYCYRVSWANYGSGGGALAGAAAGYFTAGVFSAKGFTLGGMAGYYGAMNFQEGNSDFIDYYREYLKNGSAGFLNFEKFFEGKHDLYNRPIPDESSSETFKTPYDYVDKGGSSICDGIDYYLQDKTDKQNIGEIFKYMSMKQLNDQQDADWSRAFIGFKQDGFKNREDYYNKYGT